MILKEGQPQRVLTSLDTRRRASRIQTALPRIGLALLTLGAGVALMAADKGCGGQPNGTQPISSPVPARTPGFQGPKPGNWSKPNGGNCNPLFNGC